MNIGAFPGLLQGRREVRTASSTRAARTVVEGADLAHFPWHLGALLPWVASERMTIEHLVLAPVVAAAAVPR
jgi:hypothetical protein